MASGLLACHLPPGPPRARQRRPAITATEQPVPRGGLSMASGPARDRRSAPRGRPPRSWAGHVWRRKGQLFVDPGERFVETDEERDRRLGKSGLDIIGGLFDCATGCCLIAVVAAGMAVALVAHRMGRRLMARIG